MKSLVKNFDELATTKNRELVLDILGVGLESINTGSVISNSVKLQGDVLSIMGESFVLSKFKRIKVVGFGKASVDASVAIEKILGSKIGVGAVVGLHIADLKYIDTFAGTHPRPSQINVDAGEKIYEIIKDSIEEDLVIVLVSGGGSSLLCYSADECDQNVALYNEFLKYGQKITEMNTVRKHLSILKGGGLVKIAYPATVVGLIFSDIPGDHFYDVASGPTYKDNSTVADAKSIIDKYNLGKFDLLETPKEDKYFEKVHNFVLVSNTTPIEAMDKRARELGFKTVIASTELYDETKEALNKIFKEKSDNTVVLAAGEPKLVVTKKGGSGGRNLYMGLETIKLKMVDDDSVFVALASDGMDNGDSAGAIVDKNTIEKVQKLSLNVDDSLDRFDVYPFFKSSGDMIMTGPTGANVSDLMILLTKK